MANASDDSPTGSRVFDFGTGAPLPTVNTLNDQSSSGFTDNSSRDAVALGASSDGFVITGGHGVTSAAVGPNLLDNGTSNWEAGEDVLLPLNLRQESHRFTSVESHFDSVCANALNNTAATESDVWNVVGTGAIDGDGRDDTLLHHVDSTLSNWLGVANGGFTPNAATTLATDWIVQPADLWI